MKNQILAVVVIYSINQPALLMKKFVMAIQITH